MASLPADKPLPGWAIHGDVSADESISCLESIGAGGGAGLAGNGIGGALSLPGDVAPFELASSVSDGGDFILAGTPDTGPPGTWDTNPGSGQMRLFGNNGVPVVDFDCDHNHGQGMPHAHNWDDMGWDYPVRGPGVSLSPLP